MTTVAIMQPTYLPWCGYFDMIDQADVFVLLDNVEISRQSWQTRNRIRGRDGNMVWLSVPITAHHDQLLNTVKIDNERGWKNKHIRTIEQAYGHTPDWAIVQGCISLYEHNWAILPNLTSTAIRKFCRILGINTKIISSSSLARQRHNRIGRIADILQSCGATEFLQTAGGKAYLADVTDIEGIPIRWHEYEHPVYDQGGAPFMSHLAIVDLLAWHGPDALDIIRSGRITKTHGVSV